MTSRIARVGAAIASVALAVVVAAPAALAYPPNPTNPTVLAGGAIVVVSQETANQTTPRKLLRPLATTPAKGQKVSVRRGAALAFVPTHLKKTVRYIVSARINGRWVTIGPSTVTDPKGQAQLPVVRLTKKGVVPIRLASGADRKSPYFFNAVVSTSGRVS